MSGGAGLRPATAGGPAPHPLRDSPRDIWTKLKEGGRVAVMRRRMR